MRTGCSTAPTKARPNVVAPKARPERSSAACDGRLPWPCAPRALQACVCRCVAVWLTVMHPCVSSTPLTAAAVLRCAAVCVQLLAAASHAQVLLECIIEEYHCLRKAASIGSTTSSPSSSDGGSKIKAA